MIPYAERKDTARTDYTRCHLAEDNVLCSCKGNSGPSGLVD